jgi:hypothetical protein
VVHVDDGLEVVVQLGSDKFALDSEAWRAQTAPLFSELRRSGFSLRKDHEPMEGQRGGAAELILALKSAGALTAAVAVFRAWLDRDTSRRVVLRHRATTKDGEIVIDLRADKMNNEAIKALLSKLEG